MIPVGTTALRLIETAARETWAVRPWVGATDIFIYPGFEFHVADALMTNFHLPKSTLMMLVSALMGTERVRQIYRHALNEKYRLNLMITDSKNDIDKAFILMDWTHNQWKHNGNNNSKESNALNILERANNGERFRCVEYGIVLSATLNSISILTRTLGLKTKDVETTKYGAGHVVSEAYIPDLKKWVFMDPQINYIPYLNGIPLNAVEYQKAIIENKQAIELRNHNGVIDKEKAFGQINWIGKYLYYFDVSFDSSKNRINCHKKNKLMLVPINAKEPTVFQINSKMTNYLYTNNLNDFYKEPKIL